LSTVEARRDTKVYGSLLFSAAIGDIVFPGFLIFLPLLAFQLGGDALEVGAVGGAANAMYAFMPYVMGRFSDRVGSRHCFVIGSFAILTTVALLDSLYPSPLNLIVFRAVEGLAWATLYPALQAGLSDLGTRDARKSLAAYNMVWSGSFAVGPLIIAALVFLSSIQKAFLVISALLFLTLLVNLAALGSGGGAGRKLAPASGSAAAPSGPPESEKARKLEVSKAASGGVLFYFLMTAVTAVAANVFFAFFPPLAASVGFNAFLVGVVSFAYGAARFFTYLLLNSRRRVLHAVLDRSGRRGRVYLSVFATCAACLPFLLAPRSFAVYLIACPIIAIGFGINFMIAQTALVAEAPAARRGLGAGLVESSVGAGGAVGPIVAGAVSGGSFTLPFAVPIFSYLVGSVAAAANYRKEGRRRRGVPTGSTGASGKRG
jgi:MFS family permease